MKNLNLKKSTLLLLIIIIITEILSGVILVLWIYFLKGIDRIDLREKIALYSNQMPYGLQFNKTDVISKVINADPHLIYYPPDLRFGEYKSWLKKIPIETINIIILGGSTVEGDGAIDQESTIAKQLENYLNERQNASCKKIKVLNEGISGYHAKQQYFLLTYGLIPQLGIENIAMVINLDGVNDYLGWASKRVNNSKHPFAEKLGTRELYARAVMQEFLTTGKVNRVNWVQKFYNSTLTTKLALSLYNTLFGVKVDTDSFGYRANMMLFEFDIEQRVEDYLYWKKMTEITLKGMDIKSYQIVQPYIKYKLNLTNKEKGIRENDSRYPNEMWINFDKYYSILRNKIKDFNFIIDLSNFFENESDEVYIDHVHYNSTSQKKLAKKIDELIAKELPCKNL